MAQDIRPSLWGKEIREPFDISVICYLATSINLEFSVGEVGMSLTAAALP